MQQYSQSPLVYKQLVLHQ